MNDQVKTATEQMRELTDDEVRERVIRLAFAGDRARFDMFVSALREALPPDVTVVLRGSAVIGVRWEDGAPFDADGPGTSDIDLTLVGGDMLKLWSDDAFYIPKLPHGTTERRDAKSLSVARAAASRVMQDRGA
jgi:hypothetical protein